MSRLDTVIKIFKWQGGTIHQANEEAQNCLERHLDILSMNDKEFEEFISELSIYYPKWIGYHKAEDYDLNGRKNEDSN